MPGSSPPSPPDTSESPADGETQLTLDDTTKRVLRRALGPVIKLATSTAAIGGLLLFFGFLSQSALFGFAGLPMLTLDPASLIEAGAEGVVDSVGLTLSNPVRMSIITLLFAGAILVSLFRHRPRLRRLLGSPILCLVLQIGVLVLLASLLPAEIEIATKGSPVRWEERVREAEDARRSVRESGLLEPEAEQRQLWRTTYRLKSWLWSPLNRIAELSSGAIDPSVALESYGQPLRLSREATTSARELYGWLFLATLSLVFFALALHVWRARLMPVPEADDDEAGASDRATAPDEREDAKRARLSGPRRRNVVDTSRRIVEPLLVFTALLAVALLPAAHGVLTFGGFGHEEVIVRLRASETCSFGGPGASVDRARSTGAGGDTEPISPERALACSKERLAFLEHLTDGYSLSLQQVIQSWADDTESTAALDRYRIAVDLLIEEAVATSCVLALQQVWQLRPHSAVFERTPEAAQYFWDRWQDIQAEHSLLRFGYILDYPRGKKDDQLAIFETLTPQTPLRRGRWILREIPRTCIEETIVVPSVVEMKSKLESAARRLRVKSDSEAVEDLGRYLHPITLRTVVELLRDPTPSLGRQGVLITLTGTLAGLFTEQEPTLAREATDILQSILVNREMPLNHRRSAASALRLVSGTYAASKWVETLEELGDQEMRSVGTSITTAGYLARDAWLAHEESQHPRADHRDRAPSPDENPYRVLATRIVEHLEFIIKDEDSTEEERAAACTALFAAGQTQATQAVVAGLRTAHRKREPAALATCITAAGNAGIDEARPILREILLHPEEWFPEEVVSASLQQLFRLGLTDEADTVLALYLSDDAGRAAHAAMFIEDVDPRSAGDRLFACAEDDSRTPEMRRRCLHGLLLTDDFEDGDGGFADRAVLLTDPAEADPIRESACMVLREFRARKGIAARFALERRVCGEISTDQLSSDTYERWGEYVEGARALVDSGSAAAEPTLDPIPEEGDLDELLRQREAEIGRLGDDPPP